MEATVLTEHVTGEMVIIPRIPLMPSDHSFQFTCKEFPVKLLFALTISEAQGQSLNEVSTDLRDECFSHGQLSVACSKVGSSKGLGHI
jgi:ATP-dependent DNA helicase PIF1